jgi:hypothetical protein
LLYSWRPLIRQDSRNTAAAQNRPTRRQTAIKNYPDLGMGKCRQGQPCLLVQCSDVKACQYPYDSRYYS